MRTRARIVEHGGHEICRVDVAACTEPTWAKTSKGERIFFVRMNNSTHAMPAAEVDEYLRQRSLSALSALSAPSD